jgi:hypothetical protein
MKTGPRFYLAGFVGLLTALLLPAVRMQMSVHGQTASNDPRNIKNGFVIPDEGYSDQPYIVITNDGNWLCVMTTGHGVEGEGGQHVVATISKDKGKTWSALIDIEPAPGPEASWAVPLKTPGGRVYAFYSYNKANLRLVPNTNAAQKRVDTLGVYAYKYSDDNGLTWSKDRYEIPIHTTDFDRDNNFGGSTLFFWGVSKPIEHKGAVYWGWNRVGRWGTPGTLVRSQGHFLTSDNLLTEKDPARIRWRILPDSDNGLRAPKGTIAEEANLVAMSDGQLYATYRTIDGYLCDAYSRDKGRTWTPDAYATYSPNGRRIKHPRAYAPVWKLKNGKYLLWFHNNGGEAAHTPEWGKGSYYQNRNPVWALGGVEQNGRIHWSEPEILLYDDDPKVRMSYPDLIEDGGKIYITETQKTVARVHEIDPTLLEGMWNQSQNKQLAKSGLVATFSASQLKAGSSIETPALPDLSTSEGFTIDLWARFKELNPGQNLLDARNASGKGFSLTMSDRFTLVLSLNDGKKQSEWDSDPGTYPGSLRINDWLHISVIVDARAKIISFVVDGVLNDGGATRQFGWGRLDPALADVSGLKQAKVAQALWGEIGPIRFYNRPLRTSEAVGNFRAGRQ